MPTLAIQARAVVKEFPAGAGRVRVLRSTDLAVPSGGITMLVGPSGCGKTTLLALIAGLGDPDAGSLHVLGADLRTLSDAARIAFRRARMGFVFQQYNLLPSLTAAENAAVSLLASGMRRREAVATARRLLARLGLADHADKLPRQLSGGQQQRVAVARALVHEPQVVLCDEPTAALDAAAGLAVMQLLSEVAVAPNRAVLVVTHDNRVFGLADRIAFMEDGRVTHVRVRDDAPTPAPTPPTAAA